jgi:hypothetical protein
MIAMPLAYRGFSESQLPEPSNLPAAFEPLDPGILNASIPAFFIGRNRDGLWLARDLRSENGGLFLFRNSAMAFARRASRPFGCAMVFSSETFELDVDNGGNPLAGYLRPLLQLITLWRRSVANGGA